MYTIEEQKIILETITNVIGMLAFTIVGVWAIIKYVKMNEAVKKVIIKEKMKNV